jgi:CHAT domain-containing protein
LLLDPPERRDGSLLALGGVDYNHLPTPGGRPSSGADSAASSPAVLRGGESACRVALPTFFPKLPGTETEVENLASLWARATAGRVTPGRITTLTGVEATEASLRSAVGAHQVVHLATHGFVSGAGCMRPPREGARGIGGLSLGTNPATETKVLFGLALAGANRRSAAENSDQDGILTTEEIVDLDLNGVEWVVLSACDTGLGVIHPGEGVYGLRHTFQVAGAATLIFSLWPVDDSSTRDWMRDLYEARFGRGLTTMDSVNYASLAALLRQRSQGNDNPASWAAFLATGRWN